MTLESTCSSMTPCFLATHLCGKPAVGERHVREKDKEMREERGGKGVKQLEDGKKDEIVTVAGEDFTL